MRNGTVLRFRSPSWHIECARILAVHFTPLVGGKLAGTVLPNAEEANRAPRFCELQSLFGQDVGSAFIEKSRSATLVSGHVLDGGCARRDCDIVSGMIGTSVTLARAARTCCAASTNWIFATAAHNFLIDGASALMAERTLSGIAVVDTAPSFRPRRENAGTVVVFDIRGTVANAITARHERN